MGFQEKKYEEKYNEIVWKQTQGSNNALMSPDIDSRDIILTIFVDVQ